MSTTSKTIVLQGMVFLRVEESSLKDLLGADGVTLLWMNFGSTGWRRGNSLMVRGADRQNLVCPNFFLVHSEDSLEAMREREWLRYCRCGNCPTN